MLMLYAIKSSIVLALLYLPYTLLLRRETFFRLNRAMLLAIVVVSLVVPWLEVPNPFVSSPVGEAINNVVMLPVLVVGADTNMEVQETATKTLSHNWLVTIYLTGMLAFLLWKLVGVVRLVRFIPRGCLWTDRIDDVIVYCHTGHISAFSWLRSIVIGEDDAKGAILDHELAHIRMGHSWDTLLISLVEVLQWFNPCIWMLDASLREVHEYEADDAVLRRGISVRDYQLLLIEKAVARTPYPMVNAFRHSQLKNRITMMTKKKSTVWARLKVLYALPLTLVALGALASQQEPLTFINNKRVTKAEVKKLDPKKIAHVEVLQSKSAVEMYGEEAKDGAIMITTTNSKTLKAVPGTMPLRIVVDGQELTAQEAVKAVQGKEIHNNIVAENELHVTTSDKVETTVEGDDDPVMDVAEQSAEFPDSLGNIYAWLSRNISYPKEAQEKKIEGRVAIEFIIEKDGSIKEVRTLKSPDALLSAEGERVIRAMPRWKPARHGNKPVRMRYVLPISFKLPTEQKVATVAIENKE